MTAIDDAAANLARASSMSLEQARAALVRGASPNAVWIDEMRRMGVTDVPDTETDPYMFMAENNITEADFRAALIEYRNIDTGYVVSPWAMDEINILSPDFVNWYRWERP